MSPCPVAMLLLLIALVPRDGQGEEQLVSCHPLLYIAHHPVEVRSEVQADILAAAVEEVAWLERLLCLCLRTPVVAVRLEIGLNQVPSHP